MLLVDGRQLIYMLVDLHHILIIAMSIENNAFPKICYYGNMCFKIKGNHSGKKITNQFIGKSSLIKRGKYLLYFFTCFNIFLHSLFFVSITIVTGPSFSNST